MLMKNIYFIPHLRVCYQSSLVIQTMPSIAYYLLRQLLSELNSSKLERLQDVELVFSAWDSHSFTAVRLVLRLPMDKLPTYTKGIFECIE